MAALYTAGAESTGEGRGGRVRSSDGVLELDLAMPKELGGPGGDATNPEQLFAAGYAACFHSALQAVARKAAADVTGSSVTAEVGIGKNGSGGFGLQVELVAALPGVQREQAEQLVEQADQMCPYSNAVRGNIDIELTLS